MGFRDKGCEEGILPTGVGNMEAGSEHEEGEEDSSDKKDQDPILFSFDK